jgi:hypothetical protein
VGREEKALLNGEEKGERAIVFRINMGGDHRCFWTRKPSLHEKLTPQPYEWPAAFFGKTCFHRFFPFLPPEFCPQTNFSLPAINLGMIFRIFTFPLLALNSAAA